MTFDLKTYIDSRPLTLMQYSTIAICFLMNMLDGMDVLVISYTAPAIAKMWNVGPEALGGVFSSGLIGMTLGALLLSPLADKYGRKKLMIISGIIMAVGIYSTAYAPDLKALILLRFVSGAGIGCMLASTAVMIAEYTPHKSKDLWIAIGVSGYPIGAVLSGLVAAQIIPGSGWQAMFKIAGTVTFLSVPLIYLFLFESIDYYIKAQPSNALQSVNKLLAKLNIPSLQTLPEVPTAKSAMPISKLMEGDYRKHSIQLWTALFLAFATLYFLTNWIPKLAANTGVSMKAAIYAGTLFNVGAILGIWVQGYFSSKYSLKKTIGALLIFTGIIMATFKFYLGSNLVLFIYSLLGFGIQGGFVGMYAAAARLYPTEFRSTGVGWSIGIGRLGGIIGPMVGGILIGMGLSMVSNFLIFAIPTVIGGVMTLYISSDKIS